MRVSGKTIWVVQKYIERPLIILGKKFDIRQWVLISSVNPLTIWLWMTPYLRFTSQDYNPANARNKFQHLTNACVSGQDTNQQVKQLGQHRIEHNMWETHQMQAFLMDQHNQDGDFPVDHWNETVVPQIKEAVIASVLSCQQWLEHRDNSHALLGYDLMLDEQLNVWLIEINSSPAMDFSTPITEKLVK